MGMDQEIIIAIVILVIYIIGFAIVGVLGFWAKVKDPLLNTGLSITSMGTIDNHEVDLPETTSAMYFRTDSLITDVEKNCCNEECQEKIWNIYEYFIIMSIPFLNLLDHVSDYVITVH